MALTVGTAPALAYPTFAYPTFAYPIVTGPNTVSLTYYTSAWWFGRPLDHVDIYRLGSDGTTATGAFVGSRSATTATLVDTPPLINHVYAYELFEYDADGSTYTCNIDARTGPQIWGVVQDASGTPVPGANVALSELLPGSSGPFTVVATATADESGRYQLNWGLGWNQYKLSAVDPRDPSTLTYLGGGHTDYAAHGFRAPNPPGWIADATVTIAPAPPAPTDAYEPDDIKSQATSLTTDGTVQHHTLTITPDWTYHYDVDWLKFQAKAGHIYRFTLGVFNEFPDVTIEHSDGSPAQWDNIYVGGDRQPDMFAPSCYVAHTDETMYVRVDSHAMHDQSSVTTYDASVLDMPLPLQGMDDQYEPDNILPDASLITTDGVPQMRSMIGTDRNDWVAFPVVAGKNYEVVSSGPLAKIFSANGTQIDNTIYGTGGTKLEYFSTFTGVAYIDLTPWNGTADYTISVTQQEPVHLTGHLSVDPGGGPAAGAEVRVWTWGNIGYGWQLSDSGSILSPPLARTTVNADGSWAVDVSPGTYGVSFSDFGGPWGSAFYNSDGTAAFEESLWYFGGVPGQTISLDDTIGVRAAVEGTVTDSVSQAAEPGVPVHLQIQEGPAYFDAWWDDVQTTQSDDSGHYSFAGIDPGFTYRVKIDGVRGMLPLFPETGQLTLSPATTLTVPFELAVPGTLTGHVTNALTGEPIPGITVEGPGFVGTDGDGRYLIPGIPAGSYQLFFLGTQQGYGWGYAQPAFVSWGATTTVDYALMPVDSQPPSTTATYPADWSSATATVTFDGHDVGTAGYRVVHYRYYPEAADPVDGTTNATGSVQVVGVHRMRFDFAGEDNLGNLEATQTVWLHFDAVPPATSADVSAGATVTKPEVSLVATDPDSGVASTWYSLDASTPTTLPEGAAVPLTSFGHHVLQYWSVDRVGNAEPTHTVDFAYVDNTPPTTAIGGVPAGWVNHAVDLVLDPVDPDSPVGITSYYGLNAPATTLYSSAVHVSSEGTTVVNYGSVDASGNVELPSRAFVRIDESAPRTLSDVKAKYAGLASIRLVASDLLSGVAGVHWRLDGVDGSGPLLSTSTQGAHTLLYWSTDVAGNSETTHSATFIVVPPVPQTTKIALAGATSCRAGATYHLSGLLTPSPASCRMRVDVERRVGNRWVQVAVLSPTAAAGKFNLTYRIPKKGTWRLTAHFDGLKSVAAIYRSSSRSKTIRAR